MPSTHFKCPDGQICPIQECIQKCRMNQRCMSKPAIKAIASKTGDRRLQKFSVTELLRGTRESYLCKRYNYPVDPNRLMLSTEGTALHDFNEKAVKNSKWVMTETRFENNIATGQIDSYGYVVNDEELSICDYKLTTGSKVAKSLGIGKVEIETGEFYKTGLKKGQPKTRKEIVYNKLKSRMEWALQQNFYRMLLEEYGYHVDSMYIQAYIRDYSKTFKERLGLEKPQYLIKLNKISDTWLKRWFGKKKELLEAALKEDKLPPLCSTKETWGGKKCEEYCDVAHICKRFQEKEQKQKDLGQQVIERMKDNGTK